MNKEFISMVITGGTAHTMIAASSSGSVAYRHSNKESNIKPTLFDHLFVAIILIITIRFIYKNRKQF